VFEPGLVAAAATTRQLDKRDMGVRVRMVK
jgi:hypothetical protein